jgi:V/A-type H+-transporting ATPase subunit A
MMKVVGEEGTSLGDFIDYLKGEFLDSVYLQQNAYDPVDEATPKERQQYIFDFIYNNILRQQFSFEDKDKARHFFQVLRQQFRGWNSAAWGSDEFKELETEITSSIGPGRASKENK